MVTAKTKNFFIIITATIGVLSGCATNPVTGKSELTLVSESEEISTGQRQYSPAQQSAGGVYEVDLALTNYVNEVGQRIAAVSDRELPYEFVVINDSSPNAWALPGGKIAINRGLLLTLENEAELAAVLSHEIVHAAARHGAKAMERAMLLQGAVMLTAISSQDSEYSNYIVGGASIGAQLINQRYGRTAELEADQYGMEYMARAGYDPAAAVSLQKKFVALKQGQSSDWLSGLFASHPPSEERVAKNQATETLLKTNHSQDWEVGSRRYVDHLAYLESKKPAYDAFDQAMTLLADKESAVALNRVNRAIKLEPREPRFYGLRADIHFHEKQFDQAVNEYGAALNKDDDFYQYYLGRGLAHAKLGDRARARADLEKSNSLLPTALATNELGNLSLAAGNRAEAKRHFATVARSSGPLSASARESFVRLDLADNPSAHFQGRYERRGDQLVVIVVNRSGLSTRGATVQIIGVIDAEYRQTQRKLGAMQPNGAIAIPTGWKINESSSVEMKITVVSATL